MRVWLIYDNGQIKEGERYWGIDDFRWVNLLETVEEDEEDPIGILILPDNRLFTLDLSQ